MSTDAPQQSKNDNRRRNNGNRKDRPNSKRPRGSGASGNNSNVCFSFSKNGVCPRGDDCKFRHELSTVEKDPELCRAFQKGSCSRGDQCRYLHVVSPIPSGGDACEDAMMTDTAAVDAPVSSTGGPAAAAADPLAASGKVHITDKKFSDLKVSPATKRAMAEVFQFECMTVVQAETLPVILKGTDCLARAKTGTGKTLAFLIPTVELLLKSNQKKSKNDIDCLVLSPTRELAFQIQTEAESLVKFHPGIRTVACVGGTNINKDTRALETSTQILVATPGRLLDHLQNYGLAKRFENMQVLIFDECDQLLDQGFRPDLERILKQLEPSKRNRQTLLFSATMPSAIEEIAAIAMKPDYSYIDTVGDDEEQTHLHVPQYLYVASQAEQIAATELILAQHVAANPNYKIIVFFTTARLTGFMADLFNSQSSRLGYSVLEIHSRKSQSVRQKASDKFRSARSAVLFSSDVSARGMDYPDVSFVLQVGITERAQYIHRLGRTARAGKNGSGALLLAPYEQNWMKSQLSDLPLQKTAIPQGQSVLKSAVDQVSQNKDLIASAEQAYRAWLGFYNGHLKKVNWNKDTLVVQANQWGEDVGLTEQPSILQKTVGKMGLKGVRGLKLE